ncbi:MAG: DUF6259 domain-containing protein [Petrimonas sp.]|jgi:hypothetical protein
MKVVQNSLFTVVLVCLLALSFYQCKSNISDSIVFIENNKVRLGFEKETGRLMVFTDKVNRHEFIDPEAINGVPWRIHFQSSSLNETILNEMSGVTFSFSKPNSSTLILKWDNFETLGDFRVEAKVALAKKEVFSYWDISVEGINDMGIKEVAFPRIEGLRDLENEKLVVPTWMGSLISEPREMLSKGSGKMEWIYPGALSSQVVAIYNADKCGFYASCNDSLNYRKNFSLTLDTLNTITYEMTNFPSFDTTTETYSLTYQAVIGSFKGDWIDVAGKYKEWAVQQRWAKESRFINGLTPAWLENTALWVWNRGKSENVIVPAMELKQSLGLPVSILWHWWHKCSYDDNFPEYLPPREGKDAFVEAVQSARDAGVNVIVYMNAIQWGDVTEEWKSGKVMPYTVKDINQNEISHVYNVFSGNALVNMCIGTSFWRDHYSSLCDSVVNTYQTSGVYMDQTCLSRMCYDKNHGHVPGGGNYWVENSAKMICQIRSKDFGDKKPIFTGEGSSENWLPHLDAFLTLEASRERYAGVDNIETIPFFQAVFHQYGITYGSYSSLVSPPYDELWPIEFAPKDAEQPLDEIFDKQFLMEQAKSFVWGVQPTIANYHTFLESEKIEEIDYLMEIVKTRYNALDYLLYGEFCRNPDLYIPRENIDISRLSIYAGRTGKTVTSFEKNVPSLYVGTWKAKNGNIAIALASISDAPITVSFVVKPEQYGILPKGNINIITSSGKKFLDRYTRSAHIDLELEPKGICIIELTSY